MFKNIQKSVIFILITLIIVLGLIILYRNNSSKEETVFIGPTGDPYTKGPTDHPPSL